MKLMDVVARLNGVGTPNSWRSSDTADDASLSPVSTTPASEPDADLSYTIGVTESTPYACQFCEKAFPRLSYLKRHEQVHGDQMPFRCDFCQRLFKHKRSRDRHVKLHTGDRKYRCPHCESAFSRSDHLKIHLKTHDNAKPYQCTVCNRGYNTAAALTSHMQNHKKADSTSSLHNGHHQAASLQSGFRCLDCAALFPTARELQEHGSMCHDPRRRSEGGLSPCSPCSLEPILCPTPDRSRTPDKTPERVSHELRKRIKLAESSSTESPSSSPGLSCAFCARSDFCSPESLQSHVVRRHHGPRHYPQQQQGGGGRRLTCDYCGLHMATVQALQKHTLGAHSFADLLAGRRPSPPVGLASLENVYCSLCTRTFPGAAELTDHVRQVHEDASGKSNGKAEQAPKAEHPPAFNGTSLQSALLCSQCNAGFPDFESFRTHLRSHLDACKNPSAGPNVSPIPSSSSSVAAALLLQRKLSCPECQTEFPGEEQLEVHLTSHFLSSGAEYGCPSCLSVFPCPEELQRHLLDAHALRLFRCALCRELFESKSAIQVHFAVKHGGAEVRLLRCTSCSAAFRTETEFRGHVRLAHLAKARPYRCLLCDQSYSSEVQLAFHLAAHKKPFSCSLCDEAFHVEFLLDKHVASRHATPAPATIPQPEVVPSCEASSASSAPQNLSLKGRTRGNGASDEDHKCDICDATLSSETALNAHRRQAHHVRGSQRGGGGGSALSLYCAYCNESCKSRTDLENHMKGHTASPSKHKCNICDELFPSANTLAEHKLTHCKLVTANACVICKASLAGEEQFYGHVQQHHCQGRPLSCVVCRQTLASDVEVHLHARFHLRLQQQREGGNSVLLLACCVCARPFEASRLIITGKSDGGAHTYMCKDCFHTAADAVAPPGDSAGLLRCEECLVKFESTGELDSHKRQAHQQPGKTYQCIKCQMSFETEDAIQLHVASHVIQEGTEHECRLCRKVFDSPAKLQCHLIEHTFEGCSTYTCYLCSAVFTAPHLVQQHMLEHGLNARPYDCDRCHQKFFFRAELEHHAASHSPSSSASETKLRTGYLPPSEPAVGPPHPCGECGLAFPCLSNLQGHQRTHRQGADRFPCPQCPKEFSLSRNLHIHLRSHTGEKPYGCPVCPKRFARKENRKAHLKSHVGLKPFLCPHCGRTFSRRCHVKEHMRTHITSTTHPCELCPETFSSTRLLRRHLAETHLRHFEHVCGVCGDLFERLSHLEAHLSRAHDVSTARSIEEDREEGESTSASSSSAPDCTKEKDSSECGSPTPAEPDNREEGVSTGVDVVSDGTDVSTHQDPPTSIEDAEDKEVARDPEDLAA